MSELEIIYCNDFWYFVNDDDVISEINDKPSSYPLLFKEFARSKPGSLIKLRILRQGISSEIELMTTEALTK